MMLLSTLSGAAASYDFTNIPAGYTHLLLIGSLREDHAETDNYLLLTCNGDATSGHYCGNYLDSYYSTPNPGTQITGTGLRVGDIPGANAPAGSFAPLELQIANYASSAINKGLLART